MIKYLNLHLSLKFLIFFLVIVDDFFYLYKLLLIYLIRCLRLFNLYFEFFNVTKHIKTTCMPIILFKFFYNPQY